MNIFERADQMVAQSKRPMSQSEALSILSKRRRRPQIPADIKTAAELAKWRARLPYKDE